MIMNNKKTANMVATGSVVIFLVLLGLLQATPRPASAQVWHCNACSCDCSSVGGGDIQIEWPGDGEDPAGRCDAACGEEDACNGDIPRDDASGVVCAEVAGAPPVCECCSGSPPAGEYNDVDACKTACNRLNGASKFGNQTFECAAGAAAPPAGEGAAPAAPQAPVNYQQGAVITEIENPLGTTSIATLIGRVINAALGISGSIAILMIVYGGVTWLTSGGSPEKIQKGKNILVWAVIGLALIFGAYSLVNFVLSRVIGL